MLKCMLLYQLLCMLGAYSRLGWEERDREVEKFKRVIFGRKRVDEGKMMRWPE